MKELFLVFIYVLYAFIPNIYKTVVQEKSTSHPAETSEQGVLTRCEITVSILDSLAQKTRPDDLIIVIARLGERENVKSLNHRRLYNVRAYLTEYLTGESVKRKPESIILAEGESIKGYGQLEFYVQGQLVRQLKIRRNEDLLVGSCYHEPEEPCPPENRDLFPCRGKYTKPTNRRLLRRR